MQTAVSKNLPDNTLNSSEITIRELVKPRSSTRKTQRSTLICPRSKYNTSKTGDTYAAGEKLSLYRGAPGLLSTIVAVTVFPLSVCILKQEAVRKSWAQQVKLRIRRTRSLDFVATYRVVIGV